MNLDSLPCASPRTVNSVFHPNLNPSHPKPSSMSNTRLRFAIAGLLVLFLSRDLLVSLVGSNSFSAGTAAGDVAVVGNPTSLIFTTSPDGKTLYRWQIDPKAPLKEPRYLGETDAILSE